MPHYEDLDWTGLEYSKEDFDLLHNNSIAKPAEEVIGHEELVIDPARRFAERNVYERELLICRM